MFRAIEHRWDRITDLGAAICLLTAISAGCSSGPQARVASRTCPEVSGVEADSAGALVIRAYLGPELTAMEESDGEKATFEIAEILRHRWLRDRRPETKQFRRVGSARV